MDTEVLVYVDLDGAPHLAGCLWARMRKGRNSAPFEYDKDWLANPARFSLKPALQLGPGPFHTPVGKPLFGAIGDSAPDRWGRVLVRRFDRDVQTRITFLSAMSILGTSDNETRSYFEFVDVLRQHGVVPKKDMHMLWRRIVFSVLISNPDDHLRNHGFLYAGPDGWRLAPAYDVNPVPTDIKPRLLTTARPPSTLPCRWRSISSFLPQARGRSQVKWDRRWRTGGTPPPRSVSRRRRSTVWRRLLITKT